MNQRMISPDQKPSLGCNIKWKEPSEAVL